MTAYDELASTGDMQTDARVVDRNLRLDRAARALARPAPSIHYEDYPREVGKPEIKISVAAQRIANALELHLD
jgi:hypothetical protein